MQASDIYNVIDKFPAIKDHFIGVFAIDTIPKSMCKKTCLIFNKDKSDSEGSHWLCLVRTFKNNYEIFDSLGTDFHEIKPFLHFKNAVYHFNAYDFQDIRSSSCGFFSLFFLIHRMMNLDCTYFELLSEIFDVNKTTNENEVLSFFSYFASSI